MRGDDEEGSKRGRDAQLDLDGVAKHASKQASKEARMALSSTKKGQAPLSNLNTN